MVSAFLLVVVWFFFALFKSFKVYVIGWSHFLVRFWASIAPISKFDTFVWMWNSMSHLGATKTNASKYRYFMASHTSWHLAVHSNAFVLCKSFVMGAIMKAKFLINIGRTRPSHWRLVYPLAFLVQTYSQLPKNFLD